MILELEIWRCLLVSKPTIVGEMKVRDNLSHVYTGVCPCKHKHKYLYTSICIYTKVIFHVQSIHKLISKIQSVLLR